MGIGVPSRAGTVVSTAAYPERSRGKAGAMPVSTRRPSPGVVRSQTAGCSQDSRLSSTPGCRGSATTPPASSSGGAIVPAKGRAIGTALGAPLASRCRVNTAPSRCA